MKTPLPRSLYALAVLFIPCGLAAEKEAAAIGPPVTAELLTFTPKSSTKDGGFVYQLENRSNKAVTEIVLDLEFRDADGVIENRVPSTLAKTLPARAKTKEDDNGFFMSESTRKVSFVVQEVTYSDGTQWSAPGAALATSNQEKLSFVGHDKPASVELIRFRPKNVAPKGGVAWRLINHSNKAIEGFVLEFAYRDATGKIEKEVPLTVKGGPAIAPGGTREGSEDDFFLSDETRGVDLRVRSLDFVGGENWKAQK